MKKFAYLFTVGGKIVWSSENQVSLQHRLKSAPQATRDMADDFIGDSTSGMHIQLPTGEFIFCTTLE